jgi:hypothetical protein
VSDFRIFYSWQSDLPAKSNRYAIGQALKEAAKELDALYPGTTFVPDEATRDTPGSPNIALTVQEKIEQAQVFLADITTTTPANSARSYPNPNVIYELGYSAAYLGWHRIVLLFNTVHGNLATDLPFDISHQRVTPFKALDKPTKEDHRALVRMLVTAIRSVVDKNPKTPAEIRGVSIEKIRHDRDVRTLRQLFSTVILEALDMHLDEMPRCITDLTFWMWEDFNNVVENSAFALNDAVLQDCVEKLHSSWSDTLSYGWFYNGSYGKNAGSARYYLSNEGDASLSPEQQEVWDLKVEAGRKMRDALDGLLARVREHYVEIDLAETDLIAKRAWGKALKQMNPSGAASVPEHTKPSQIEAPGGT